MHNVVEIFGKALSLGPGEEIVMPCRTHSQMEVLRVSLYRQLNKLRRINAADAQKLEITRHASKKDSEYYVSIRHSANVTDAFIKRADGSIEDLFTPAEDVDLERIVKLMREDGISEEEIEQYKKEYAADLPDSC